MSTRWYPIYQRGNPQRRVFLPNFWMKLVKEKNDIKTPPNRIQFIVSSEMTKMDAKWCKPSGVPQVISKFCYHEEQ